jgi:hypothetical protein
MFESRKQSNTSIGSEFTFHNGLASNSCSNYKSLRSDASSENSNRKQDCQPQQVNTGENQFSQNGQVYINKDMLT